MNRLTDKDYKSTNEKYLLSCSADCEVSHIKRKVDLGPYLLLKIFAF